MHAQSESNFGFVALASAVLAACNKDGKVAEADVCFLAEHINSLDSVVHAFILATLAALRPQRAARSALEKLAIRLETLEYEFFRILPKGDLVNLRIDQRQKATAEDLQASLESLSSIRSLKLMPNAFPLDSTAAAAIASSLPNLQSIHFSANDCSVLAVLATLSALRDVVINWFTPERFPTDPSEIGDAFSTLAAGPAGKSLRSIVLDPDPV
eukprot:tig00020499_g9789.t1